MGKSRSTRVEQGARLKRARLQGQTDQACGEFMSKSLTESAGLVVVMVFLRSLRLSRLGSSHIQADFYPAGMAVLTRLAEGL